MTAVDGRLTAFVSVPGTTPEHPLRIEVWQGDGTAEWEKVAELPESASAVVRQAAYGAGQWIAVGQVLDDIPDPRVAWASSDGIQWHVSRFSLPAAESVGAFLGYNGGFVVVGSSGDAPGTACGTGAPYLGLTWTSPDGVAWHELPPIKGAAVVAMVTLDDAIVGLGNADAGNNETQVVGWKSTLPPSLAVHLTGPNVSPAPSGSGGGCGP